MEEVAMGLMFFYGVSVGVLLTVTCPAVEIKR